MSTDTWPQWTEEERAQEATRMKCRTQEHYEKSLPALQEAWEIAHGLLPPESALSE